MLACLVAACSSPVPPADAGNDAAFGDGATFDTGTIDGHTRDASAVDARASDVGMNDAATMDDGGTSTRDVGIDDAATIADGGASTSDVGMNDAATIDDGGASDAASNDTGSSDAGPSDAATLGDGSARDAGSSDAGTDAAADDAGTVVRPAPPRLIRPLSSTYATSRRPTFAWTFDGAPTASTVLMLCEDRACSRVIDEQVVAGTSWRHATDLAPRVYFWRVERRDAVTLRSHTWAVHVRAPAGLSTDSTTGSVVDVNGDGLADVARGNQTGFGTGSDNSIWIVFGRTGALPSAPDVDLMLPDAHGLSGYWSHMGDLDGDGFTDIGFAPTSSSGRNLMVVYGTAGVFDASRVQESTVSCPEYLRPGGGDVNGDGYADAFCGSAGMGVGSMILATGSPTGMTTSMPLPRPGGATLSNCAWGRFGDSNADGVSDMYANCQFTDRPGRIDFWVPGSAALTTAVEITVSIMETPVGDIDGDGYPDAVGPSTVRYGGALFPMDPPVALDSSLSPIWFLSGVDLNGDGLSDIGDSDNVIFGAARGIPMLNRAVGESIITSAGDFDGDGIDDLVSVPGSDGTIVHLVRGGTSAFTIVPGTLPIGAAGLSYFVRNNG